MARVALEGVSKAYPAGIKAVDGLELEIGDRELLVLVGPSGCGKSTTLRLIAGLERPTSGTVRIDGQIVNDVPSKERDIAMVFQHPALYPHMSVYKNMVFGLQLRYGGSWIGRLWKRLTRPAEAVQLAARRRAMSQQVLEAARSLSIEHLLDRMPWQLSGGEQQRVALGRAIVRRPAAFLFDEPLSNLDAQLRVEMRRELKQLHGRLQTTMVYVTHDQLEAMTLGERIAVMNRGKIQQVGSPKQVYQRPRNRFVASFIGSPPMNLVTGRLQRTGDQLRFVSPLLSTRLSAAAVSRLTPASDRAVVLGVRPEHVRLGPPSADGQLTVALVESLGDAALVHLELAANELAPGPGAVKNYEKTIVSKTEPYPLMQPGDVVGVTVDAERTHLFDSQTGENVSLPAAHAEAAGGDS